MPVETGVDGIEDLNASWPVGTEPKSQGDDHLRNIKAAVLGSFPNTNGPNVIDAPLTFHDGTADTHGATVAQLNNAVAQWGRVGLDGNSGATPGSGGWTSARLGLGHYRLTFTKAASDTENQSIVCTVAQQDAGKHNRSITTLAISATVVDVFVYNTVLADKVDDDWCFTRNA